MSKKTPACISECELIDQLQKKLLESENNLKESQEVAQLGSYSFNIVAGRWTSSKILDEIFGIDENYLKTLENWIAIIHPSWRNEMTRYLTEEVLGNRIPFDKDYKIVRIKDGSELWVYGRGKLNFDEEGRPVSLFGTIQDITARKETEQNLRISEEKFTRAFKDHPTAMQILDLKTGKRLAVNNSLAKMLEIDSERLLGVNIMEVNYWKDQSAVKKHITKLISEAKFEKGYVDKVAVDVITASGKLRNTIFSSSLMDIPGELICVTSTVDITEQKKAEEELHIAMRQLEILKEKVESENLYLQEEIKQEHNFIELVGESKPMMHMLKQIELVSPTDSTVLIQGETGTGKELIARAIHDHSKRHNHPLVKVNCPALPENLIESELFGHEKGAFTSAIARKTGRFELADKGTIFLDEIGDLPLSLQVKLLRVLQEGEFEKVGGIKTQKVNVRVIAATNRDLEQLVLDGKFRQDLYFRLKVFPITAPSLRARTEDIPLLVQHFVKKFNPRMGKNVTNIPQKIIDKFQKYHWPGNVRELENIIERAMIFNQGGSLFVGDWFDKNTPSNQNNNFKTLEEVEKNYILDVLNVTRWKIRGKNGTAEILGLKPTTLESRMKRLGITRELY